MRAHNSNLDYARLSHTVALSVRCDPSQKTQNNTNEHNITQCSYTYSLIGITILSILLFSIVTIGNTYAKFNVITEIDNVNSYSGKYHIDVYLSNGDHKHKFTNLGKLADKLDDSEIQILFTFKHSPKSFIACIDGPDLSNCARGINSPAKIPELVKFILP